MAGHAFAKARASKQPQGPCQVAEPIAPFFGQGFEPGRTLVDQGLGHELHAIDLAPLIPVRWPCHGCPELRDRVSTLAAMQGPMGGPALWCC